MLIKHDKAVICWKDKQSAFHQQRLRWYLRSSNQRVNLLETKRRSTSNSSTGCSHGAPAPWRFWLFLPSLSSGPLGGLSTQHRGQTNWKAHFTPTCPGTSMKAEHLRTWIGNDCKIGWYQQHPSLSTSMLPEFGVVLLWSILGAMFYFISWTAIQPCEAH